VVYGAGKTPEQVATIAERFARDGTSLLITRVTAAQAAAVRAVLPDVVHDELARVLHRVPEPPAPAGLVGVLCAGTVDLPVAEEAAVTAELLGARVERVHDVGVAGLHRLGDAAPLLRRANALVVVAGMEGALPGVVAGLTDRPVLGVPTSTGYGAALGGVAALLTMINACAPGLSVVNVDNGFGAGYAAGLINRRVLAGVSGELDQGSGTAHADG
jgi:NCAIR mutase (PurE)-related protein